MLSIIIPSRKEKYLWDTIRDIEEHSVTKPEILWKEDTGEGQRAICNQLVHQAKGKYVMKTDAHCSFGPGFDQIMLEEIEDNMVIAPLLLPLDAEKWTVSHHNKMANYVFDEDFVMHHAPTQHGMIVETMCLQGSCFMTLKDNWSKWDLCDESLGSWGHQGVEVGIQTWTNGGRCVTTKNTYYGHLFRHSKEEFPYKRNQREIDKTHKLFIDKFSKKDIGWLRTKFNS